MAIADLSKAELVAPRDAVTDLLRSLERAALLHVDDVHNGLPEELAQWEQRDAPDTADVDGHLAAARWILDLFPALRTPQDEHAGGFLRIPAGG